jgi:hypothetical protein
MPRRAKRRRGLRRSRFLAAMTVPLMASSGCGPIVIGGGDGDGDLGPTEVLEAVTFDEAWDAAIDTFEELRLSIDNLERASGVITTDWILLNDPEDYMACEDDVTRNEEGRFNVFLRELEDGIRVTVNASFRAEDDTDRRIACDSEGEYEELILRRIRSKVT